MEARVLRVFRRNGINRRRGNSGGGTRGPTPSPGTARDGPTPGHGVGTLVPVFDSPSDFRVLVGKIGTSVFAVSNSENISRTTFLKLKTAENRELTLGILSIG